jgi:Beta-lactamase superfamily domain
MSTAGNEPFRTKYLGGGWRTETAFRRRGGTLQRLTQLKVRWQDVNGVFLTHLHSDHIVGFPDLWLPGWLIVPGRSVPLQVWGPSGTSKMMSRIKQAYEYDISIRLANDGASPDGVMLVVEDISEGVVYNKGGVKVTAFEVDHARSSQRSATASTMPAVPSCYPATRASLKISSDMPKGSICWSMRFLCQKHYSARASLQIARRTSSLITLRPNRRGKCLRGRSRNLRLSTN